MVVVVVVVRFVLTVAGVCYDSDLRSVLFVEMIFSPEVLNPLFPLGIIVRLLVIDVIWTEYFALCFFDA